MQDRHKRIYSGKKRWHAVIDRLPKDREITVAEIGVWDGRMSEQLLSALPKMELFCIDRWEPPEETDSYYNSGSEIARMPEKLYENKFMTFLKKVKPWILRVNWFKKDSILTSLYFEDGYFDLVFLDGDHSYEGVKRDIEAWYSKVKPGGWISGHDYDHPEQGEVKKAVLEYFKDHPGIIEIDRNRTWFYQIPEVEN